MSTPATTANNLNHAIGPDITLADGFDPAYLDTPAPGFMQATYHQTRFDLQEGRDWLVTSENGHAYVVSIWVEEGLGRIASCRCRAFAYGLACKHIKYAALVDSQLTGAPMRDVRPVFAS